MPFELVRSKLSARSLRYTEEHGLPRIVYSQSGAFLPAKAANTTLFALFR